MPVFKFGSIIKSRREEMGYTQEELADGICSVPTLSRIENGERMPSKEHFEMLLQRLGYSDVSLDAYVDKRDFIKHELKAEIRQTIFRKEKEKAISLFEKYREMAQPPSKIDRQLLLLYEVLIDADNLSLTERCNRLEEALRLTCPKFDGSRAPMLLSYEEIVLANNIAILYFYTERKESAIELLYGLKQHYDSHIVGPEEAVRTQSMVLYNLSKILGLAERYEECIEVSSQGIRFCIQTGQCSILAKLFYNHAWAYVKRGHGEDMEAARQSVQKAIFLAEIFGQEESAKRYRRFLTEHFPQMSDR